MRSGDFSRPSPAGPLTAATIIAQAGDPARFRSFAALASYVGVVPRLHQSGKRRFSSRIAMPLGNARLRRALWMPVLVAVRLNLGSARITRVSAAPASEQKSR